MYIMRSKKDIGIRSVVAAKISSANGYSSSSSFPCAGVELDVSDVGTFFSIPVCSIKRHCSSSESCMRGVFWLWVLPAWRLAMLSQVRRLLEYKETDWLPHRCAVVSGPEFPQHVHLCQLRDVQHRHEFTRHPRNSRKKVP